MGRSKKHTRKNASKAGCLDKLLGLILLLGGLGLGVGVGYVHFRDEEIRDTWTKHTGEVVWGQGFSTSTTRGSFDTKLITVEYGTSSRGLPLRARGTGDAKVGETIEIYVDPNKSNRMRPASQIESNAEFWFLIGVPMLWMAGLLVMTAGRNADPKAERLAYEHKVAAIKAEKAERKARKRDRKTRR